MKFDPLYDQLTGHCIREICFADSKIFLTFDDGPDPDCTPKVLDLLKKHSAFATFFIIGNKAKQWPDLTGRILSESHSIGDHTIDHDTKNYFKSDEGIEAWLTTSSELLTELQLPSIGFRSPLGIKTPSLNRVVKKSGRPLVLWNIRFYDTQYGLSSEMVDKKLKDMKSGSIILLHDTHHGERQAKFLLALEHLLIECKKRGLQFASLNEKCIVKSYQEKYETRT